jgi:hypothetical protein
MTLAVDSPRRINISDDEAGFHGDHYVIDLVEHLMPYASAFVETGTYMGQTTRYVAQNYPAMPIYSCEQDAQRYANVTRDMATYPQAHIYHQISPDFLYSVHQDYPQLLKQTNLYWLDAHGFGCDKWPLREEVAYITKELSSALMLIDDFRVPNRPEFGFDAYNGQACCIEFIHNWLAHGRQYYIIYPTYREKTSKVHPLRGVGLILYGIDQFQWPAHLGKNWQAFQLPR